MAKIIVLTDYFDVLLKKHLKKGDVVDMEKARVEEILLVKTRAGGDLIEILELEKSKPKRTSKHK